MRQKAFLFALALSFCGAELLACGDKFLVAARGTRFQRGPEPGRGASVLLYAPVSSPLGERRQRAAAEKALLGAGYKPVAVGSPGELAAKLPPGTPGIVVADPADASAIEGHRGSSSVVFLRVPVSSDALLDAVDAAVRRVAQSGVAASAKP